MTGHATTVRILTPSGRGAVAVCRVFGPHALDLVRHRLTTTQKIPAGHAPIFGRFQLPDCQEEVIAYFKSPVEVELHSHGGTAIPNAIQSVLISDGAQPEPEPQLEPEFQPQPGPGPGPGPELETSFPSMADAARALLPHAATELIAKILIAQSHGLADRALAEYRARKDAGRTDADELRQLLEASRFVGRHLLDPFQVVLTGPPNAGKSSLLNAILGHSRAIVSQTAGTTRDVISAPFILDGWQVLFRDTAGLRTGRDELESQGISLAKRSLATADLILAVFDVTDSSPDPWSTLVRDLTSDDPNVEKRILPILNKSDLPRKTWKPQWQDVQENRRQGRLEVSAQTGVGLALLEQTIPKALFQAAPPPFNEYPPKKPFWHYPILTREDHFLGHDQLIGSDQLIGHDPAQR